MTAREFLERGYRIDRRIERRIEEIERLRAKLTRATAQISGMPHGGSGGDWTDADIKVLEMEARVRDEIAELCRVKREIREAIDAVEDRRYREVLEMRYIALMSWERIAVEMHYSYDWVRHLHKEALRAVKVKS